MTLPLKQANEMKMHFTKKGMQIILWKDVLLINCQRNASFTTINNSEDLKRWKLPMCAESRHDTVVVGRYLGRNLLHGNLVICIKKSKEKKKLQASRGEEGKVKGVLLDEQVLF